MTWMTSINAGVAVRDYDGDGDEDVYLLSSRRGLPNALYRNDGGLRFAEVAAASRVAAVNDLEGVSMDAVFGDVDNDGDADLFIAAYGRNRLLINRNGRFLEVGEAAGVADRGNAAAAVFFDFDGVGWLELLVGNYYGDHDLWNLTTPKILQTTFETARNGGVNRFYRNNRDGTFRESAAELGLDDTGWTLAFGTGDLDNDGDVYVANDFGYDLLYRNEGGSIFTDVLAEATGGRDTKAGMNVDVADYDLDGDLDLYVTNITNRMMPQGNMLWANLEASDWLFEDVARATGTWNGGWGWGAKFLDFDNDGDLDLYTVNGFVSDGERDLFEGPRQLFRGNVSDVRGWPDMRGLSLSGYQPSRLFRNEGGFFTEVGAAAGVASRADGRGVAVGDFDRDGDLELLVSNCGGGPELYRNDEGNRAGWLEVELVGGASGTDAVGARLTLTAGGRRLIREVDGGNGFSAQSSRVQHFGLGEAAGAIEALEGRWPAGGHRRYAGLPAGKRLLVVE